MKEDDFKKTDQELMEALRHLREKPLPKDALKGFKDEVMKAVDQPLPFYGSGMGAAAALIVAAVLMFAGAAWWLSISSPKEVANVPVKVETVQTISQPAQPENPLVPEEIIHDMMIFSELDAWTEEDEDTIGILQDSLAEEIELGLGENPGALTGPTTVPRL